MAPKRSTKEVSKKAESSRVPAPHDARIAVIAALVFSLLVAVGLPLIYLLYLRRLEKDKCDCATEHYLFQRLKMIVVAQLALVILLPITMLVSNQLARALSLIISIAVAVMFVVWFRDMGRLHCLCTQSWERTIWLIMSVLDLSYIVLVMLAAVLTAFVKK